MKKMKDKLIKILKNPGYIFIALSRLGFFKKMNDEKYLCIVYKIRTGKTLNLEKPKTFNEKLQWLKLYDRKIEYTTMVDKYAVKQYVADKIGENHIIPTLGVWDKFEDIDFDKLPNNFVLKCTHDSGGLVICRDKSKLDMNAAKKKLNKSLKRNYFYAGREWPYKDVKPRIIAEKYLEEKGKTVPEDYKVYCINGKPIYIVVFHNRFNHGEELSETVYNTAWEPQHISLDEHFKVSNIVESVPECLDKMLKYSEILSENICQSRIDFYIVNNHLYFGEITLYTASGFQRMIPEEMDYKLGQMIKLPKRKEIELV